MNRLLPALGITEYELESSEPEAFSCKINITNLNDRDTALLIGRQGENLNALQYILRLLLREKENYIQGEERSIALDVMNYRDRQIDQLTILAKRSAEEAKEKNKDVSLRPMTPYERRIIHMALKDDDSVATSSIGEGDDRRVIIKVLSQQIEI